MGNYCTKEVKIINLPDDTNNEESLKKAFPNSQSTVDLFQRSIHQHSRTQSRPVAVIQPQRPSSANIKELINSIVEERTQNLSQDLETTKKKLEYLEKELASSTRELSFYRDNFGSGKSRNSFPTHLLSRLSESNEDMLINRQNHYSTISMPSHDYQPKIRSTLKKTYSNPIQSMPKRMTPKTEPVRIPETQEGPPSEKIVRIAVVAASCSDLSSTFDQSTFTDSQSEGDTYLETDDEEDTLNDDDGVDSRSHYSVSPIGSGSLSTISRTLEDDCQTIPQMKESHPVPIQSMETLQNSPAMQSQLLQRLVHLKHSREISKASGDPTD